MKRPASFILATLLSVNISGIARASEKIVGLYQHQGWCVENYGNGISDAAKWEPCKKYPVNALSIRGLESGEYAVWFEFTGFATTPSYCSFAGFFELQEGVLELTEPYKKLECKLKIRVFPEKFVLEDPDRSCHQAFCAGTNLSLDRFEFPRWNDPSRSPITRALKSKRRVQSSLSP